MIKCEFKVVSKTLLEANNQCSRPTIVKLQPLTGEPFGSFTPSGLIELNIQNDEAEKQFEVGKEYTVDFTPIE